MIAPKTDLKEQGELIAPEAKLKALSRIIEAKDEQIRAMEKILRERKHDADKALQAGETAELEAAKESQKTKSASRQRPIFDRLFRPEE